ncbi:MAG: hypothetical protein CSA25_04770 [Desulfobacter postgatei]|uniref:Uncharacterized protein n=1 Tax=Desulfobacter postgatei TaxID=2293 RepID=A0A2G6MR49_9BACT|nr:MAG: hypothetical protein CSA25_04770 [Desulfobacter postgatei]
MSCGYGEDRAGRSTPAHGHDKHRQKETGLHSHVSFQLDNHTQRLQVAKEDIELGSMRGDELPKELKKLDSKKQRIENAIVKYIVLPYTSWIWQTRYRKLNSGCRDCLCK